MTHTAFRSLSFTLPLPNKGSHSAGLMIAIICTQNFVIK
jgi:hypothetical protein